MSSGTVQRGMADTSGLVTGLARFVAAALQLIGCFRLRSPRSPLGFAVARALDRGSGPGLVCFARRCVALSSGGLWAWGSNREGQLGLGTRGDGQSRPEAAFGGSEASTYGRREFPRGGFKPCMGDAISLTSVIPQKALTH